MPYILCSTGPGSLMSSDPNYTLTDLTYLGQPIYTNADWFIIPNGFWGGPWYWIWQPYVGACCQWHLVDEFAPPWEWTGETKATCTCTPGSTLVTTRQNWGKCVPDVSPCPDGLQRSSPGSACTACAGFQLIGGDNQCTCPSGSIGSGASCTPPATPLRPGSRAPLTASAGRSMASESLS